MCHLFDDRGNVALEQCQRQRASFQPETMEATNIEAVRFRWNRPWPAPGT
jgi:hypothetical protein